MNKLAIVILLAVIAAKADYPMRVKDARGKVITVKSKPMRIVSLAPGNTEILFALGLRDRIAGVTRRCDYPPEAGKKPKIGDMTVSIESVVALKPDLVLAHAFINDAGIPQLEKLGLTVFAIDPKTIGQVIRDIRVVGKITARPHAAESTAKKMEAAIEYARKSRAGKRAEKVLVVIQSNPLWVAGPRTFVDEMLKAANARNVAHDARPGFVTFSGERAISRNPDVILVGFPSDVDFFLKSPAWRNTAAVRNKRVYVINNDLLVRAGPRLGEGVKELARLLNRE